MHKYLFQLTIFLFIGTQLMGQSLPRRGDLGLLVENTPEGMVVSGIYPDLTGDKIGVEIEDLIVAYNGIDVKAFNQMQYWLNQQAAGDNMVLKVLRNGSEEILIGKLVPAIKENSKMVKVQYGSVKTSFGRLRTIKYSPLVDKAKATIFFISDFNCFSVDFRQNSYHPFPKLAEDMAEMGYQLIRIDMPKVGDSEGKQACWEMSYLDQTEVWSESINKIVKADKIDKFHLLSVGMGGAHLPKLSLRKEVSSAILYNFYYQQKTKEFKPLRKEVYWNEIRKYAKASSWKKLNFPILNLVPLQSNQNNNGNDANAIQKRLKHGTSELVTLPKNDYLFLAVDSEKPFLYNIENIDKYYDDGIAKRIGRWIESL